MVSPVPESLGLGSPMLRDARAKWAQVGLKYAKAAQYHGSTRLSQYALVLSPKARDTSQNIAVKVDGANSTQGGLCKGPATTW